MEVQSLEPVDENLKCDHSNKSYWAVLFCGTVNYAVQGGSTFESVGEILKCDHSSESYWAVLSCGTVYYAVQGGSTFEYVGEIVMCNHSSESYSAVLSCGVVYHVVQDGSVFESEDETRKCDYSVEGRYEQYYKVKCKISWELKNKRIYNYFDKSTFLVPLSFSLCVSAVKGLINMLRSKSTGN